MKQPGMLALLVVAACQPVEHQSGTLTPPDREIEAVTTRTAVPPTPQRLGQGTPALDAAGDATTRAGGFIVRNGRISLPDSDGRATGLFIIENRSGQTDRLLGMSSPAAESIEMIRIESGRWVVQTSMEYLTVSEMPRDDSPAARRAARDNFSLDFRLIGFEIPDDPGDGVPVTLHFERAGSFTVLAFTPVRSSEH